MMGKPESYRVVYVEPGKPACVKEIGTQLEDIQEAVGGGLFECVYPHGDRTVLVCNDEGKLLDMEGNRRLDTGSIIAGPFFVIGDAGENFRSLTDEEVNRYCYYDKEQIQVKMTDGRSVIGMVYVMDQKQDFGNPTRGYYDTVRQGYKDCHLDIDLLETALASSAELAQHRMMQEPAYPW